MNNYNNYNYDLIKIEGVSSKTYEKHMFGKEEWISVDSIKIDISVQRELQETHVSKIIKKFDPQAFGRLTVSKREDGFYYCSDGQHRLNVAKRLGLTEVPCIVVKSHSIVDEGENFIKVNEVSAKVSALDKYRIGVTVGNKEWLRVKECLDYAGVEAGTSVNKVNCLALLYKAVNSATLLSSIEKNVFVVKKALYILKHTVGTKGMSNQIVSGMIIFVRHYILTDLTDTNTTIERLKRMDYKAITSKAQDMKYNSARGKVDSYVAYLMLTEYNRNLKVKLPIKIEV